MQGNLGCRDADLRAMTTEMRRLGFSACLCRLDSMARGFLFLIGRDTS